MSALGTTVSETTALTGRELRHTLSYPALLISSIAVPVVLLLLFVYVLGGTLEAGLPAAAIGGGYVEYLMPGLLVLTIASGSSTVAINACTDMNEGIIDRFRAMALSRAAVLAGHVASGVLRSVVTVAAVAVVALAVGARPEAGVMGWVLAAGVVAAFALALSWLSVALGLGASTPEGANGATLPLQFVLPFLSSTFVPTESMPTAVRWFAEHQPFTAVAEALRALLAGEPAGAEVAVALTWSAGIAVLGYRLALARYRRGPRPPR